MPVIGECPYEGCDESLWVGEPDQPLPMFSKHECEGCKKVIWTYISRIEPKSYTEEAFLEKYSVDEKTKEISEK